MQKPAPARAVGFLTARPIAHRGLHDATRRIVENTASAFAAAIGKGYAIECDLQITRDGEAVVFHDDRLERLTEGSGLVRDRTAAEMQSLAFRVSADRVQTLAELLAQVKGQVPLVIELKSHWNGDQKLLKRATELVKTYDGPHCLMSFDPDVIAAVKLVSPATIRGVVADRAFDRFYDSLPLKTRMELRTLAYLPRTQPDFLSFYAGELPHAPIAALRASGKPIISWTIRSPEQARMALRYSDQITFERFLA